jgi:hypothetical protein
MSASPEVAPLAGETNVELESLNLARTVAGAADVPFMLTGSFALGYYGKPRMTRDLDFVVALMERHVDALVSAFSTDFYIDEDAARSAIGAIVPRYQVTASCPPARRRARFAGEYGDA